LNSSAHEADSRKKVVMIGPVAPYRGGIAQHTTMLCQALSGKSSCTVISFSRQYPEFLFPGRSDKAPSASSSENLDAEFLIDSINPLTWRRALARILEIGPDLVVLPWWHVYWYFCFGWIIRSLKSNGIETVLLCHNVKDHEDSSLRRWLANRVFRSASRFVVQSESEKQELLSRLPAASIAVHPHPVYHQFPEARQVLPRRAAVELLFFGIVRPYKGLDLLLEAMVSLIDLDVCLSVVGEFWDGENAAREFVAANRLAEKVEIVAHYVPDSEAAAYFERSDVVVLPYRSATGSGVIPVAYHYDKPVIVTRVGGFPDVVSAGETGLIVEPGSVPELVAAIKAVISGNRICTVAGFERMRKRMTWDGLADACLGAVRGQAGSR